MHISYILHHEQFQFRFQLWNQLFTYSAASLERVGRRVYVVCLQTHSFAKVQKSDIEKIAKWFSNMWIMPVRVIFDNIVELFEQYFFGIIIDLLESKYLLKNSSSGSDLNIDYVKSQKPDCRQKSLEKVS